MSYVLKIVDQHEFRTRYEAVEISQLQPGDSWEFISSVYESGADYMPESVIQQLRDGVPDDAIDWKSRSSIVCVRYKEKRIQHLTNAKAAFHEAMKNAKGKKWFTCPELTDYLNNAIQSDCSCDEDRSIYRDNGYTKNGDKYVLKATTTKKTAINYSQAFSRMAQVIINEYLDDFSCNPVIDIKYTHMKKHWPKLLNVFTKLYTKQEMVAALSTQKHLSPPDIIAQVEYLYDNGVSALDDSKIKNTHKGWMIKCQIDDVVAVVKKDDLPQYSIFMEGGEWTRDFPQCVRREMTLQYCLENRPQSIRLWKTQRGAEQFASKLTNRQWTYTVEQVTLSY